MSLLTSFRGLAVLITGVPLKLPSAGYRPQKTKSPSRLYAQQSKQSSSLTTTNYTLIRMAVRQAMAAQLAGSGSLFQTPYPGLRKLPRPLSALRPCSTAEPPKGPVPSRAVRSRPVPSHCTPQHPWWPTSSGHVKTSSGNVKSFACGDWPPEFVRKERGRATFVTAGQSARCRRSSFGGDASERAARRRLRPDGVDGHTFPGQVSPRDALVAVLWPE